MAIVYSDITTSLTNSNLDFIVEMEQGDSGRGLRIFFSDDIVVGESGDANSNLSAILWAKKPSGLMVSVAASTVYTFENSSAYEIEFSDTKTIQEILTEEGIVECQITLDSNGTYITTFKFKIKVLSNIATQEYLDSTEEYQSLLELISKANVLNNEIQSYIAQFQNQLKLTVNVRYGTTDPTVLSTDKTGDIYIKVED